MNNLALSESTALNSIVYKLEGFDPEGGNVTFGIVGSENFDVNPTSGEVKLIKELDREVREDIQIFSLFNQPLTFYILYFYLFSPLSFIIIVMIMCGYGMK